MNILRAKITASSHYLPERRVTNLELQQTVDTSDSWIVERTGIRERRVAAKGQATSDLASEAAKNPSEETRNRRFGNRSDYRRHRHAGHDVPVHGRCLVQHKIGAKKAWGFDLSGACSGFVYALATGAQFISAGSHKKVLVIGADVMTSIIDFADRATCVLFGDGGLVPYCWSLPPKTKSGSWTFCCDPMALAASTSICRQVVV